MLVNDSHRLPSIISHYTWLYMYIATWFCIYTMHATMTLLLNLVRLSRLTVVFVSAVFTLAASTCNCAVWSPWSQVKFGLIHDGACLPCLFGDRCILLTIQVPAAFLFQRLMQFFSLLGMIGVLAAISSPSNKMDSFFSSAVYIFIFLRFLIVI